MSGGIYEDGDPEEFAKNRKPAWVLVRVRVCKEASGPYYRRVEMKQADGSDTINFPLYGTFATKREAERDAKCDRAFFGGAPTTVKVGRNHKHEDHVTIMFASEPAAEKEEG